MGDPSEPALACLPGEHLATHKEPTPACACLLQGIASLGPATCLTVLWTHGEGGCLPAKPCMAAWCQVPLDAIRWVFTDVTRKIASGSLTLCVSHCRCWISPGCQYADRHTGTRGFSSCRVWVQPSGPQPKVLRNSFWVRPTCILCRVSSSYV